ncbi:MAG: DUF3288 family protein [Cyanobium sp.]
MPPSTSPSGSAVPEQSHPLHTLDRDVIDGLLAVQTPGEAQLVDAARLLMRYEGFPGAHDLQEDLAKVLRLWGLSREELHGRTREIWASGFRPGSADSAAPGQEAVGSGFDTADQDA